MGTAALDPAGAVDLPALSSCNRNTLEKKLLFFTPRVREKVNTGPKTLFSAVSSSPCFSLDTLVYWMQSLAGSNHLAGVVIGRNTKETEAEE